MVAQTVPSVNEFNLSPDLELNIKTNHTKKDSDDPNFVKVEVGEMKDPWIGMNFAKRNTSGLTSQKSSASHLP